MESLDLKLLMADLGAMLILLLPVFVYFALKYWAERRLQARGRSLKDGGEGVVSQEISSDQSHRKVE